MGGESTGQEAFPGEGQQGSPGLELSQTQAAGAQDGELWGRPQPNSIPLAAAVMQDLHLGGCLTGGEGLGAWLVSTAGPTNTLNFIAYLEGAQGRMGTVGGVGRQPSALASPPSWGCRTLGSRYVWSLMRRWPTEGLFLAQSVPLGLHVRSLLLRCNLHIVESTDS